MSEDVPLPPKVTQYCQQNNDNRVPRTCNRTRKHLGKESLQQRLFEIQILIRNIDNTLNEIFENGYVVCFHCMVMYDV